MAYWTRFAQSHSYFLVVNYANVQAALTLPGHQGTIWQTTPGNKFIPGQGVEKNKDHFTEIKAELL